VTSLLGTLSGTRHVFTLTPQKVLLVASASV